MAVPLIGLSVATPGWIAALPVCRQDALEHSRHLYGNKLDLNRSVAAGMSRESEGDISNCETRAAEAVANRKRCGLGDIRGSTEIVAAEISIAIGRKGITQVPGRLPGRKRLKTRTSA